MIRIAKLQNDSEAPYKMIHMILSLYSISFLKSYNGLVWETGKVKYPLSELNSRITSDWFMNKSFTMVLNGDQLIHSKDLIKKKKKMHYWNFPSVSSIKLSHGFKGSECSKMDHFYSAFMLFLNLNSLNSLYWKQWLGHCGPWKKVSHTSLERH